MKMNQLAGPESDLKSCNHYYFFKVTFKRSLNVKKKCDWFKVEMSKALKSQTSAEGFFCSA